MKFWKVCLVGAVLALTASADDHEDDVGAPDSNDTLDGEVITDDSDLLVDDLDDDIDELLDEVDDFLGLDLVLTDKVVMSLRPMRLRGLMRQLRL